MDQDQELNSNVQVFIVDKDLRKIILPDTTTILGVAGDICVNQVVFNIPRIVNGYDLSEFTPYIDYTNANGEGNYSSGVNIANANDTISFVWELEPDVTTYSGNVLFAVRLLKVNSSEIVKRFKTQPAKAQVMSGLNVTSQVTQEAQYDILARIEIDATNNIKQRLRAITDQHIDELNTCAENKLSDIESYVDNMSSEFNQNIIDKKKEITDLTEISKKEIEKTKINAVNDLSWKTPVDKNTADISSLKEDLDNLVNGTQEVITIPDTIGHVANYSGYSQKIADVKAGEKWIVLFDTFSDHISIRNLTTSWVDISNLMNSKNMCELQITVDGSLRLNVEDTPYSGTYYAYNVTNKATLSDYLKKNGINGLYKIYTEKNEEYIKQYADSIDPLTDSKLFSTKNIASDGVLDFRGYKDSLASYTSSINIGTDYIFVAELEVENKSGFEINSMYLSEGLVIRNPDGGVIYYAPVLDSDGKYATGNLAHFENVNLKNNAKKTFKVLGRINTNGFATSKIYWTLGLNRFREKNSEVNITTGISGICKNVWLFADNQDSDKNILALVGQYVLNDNVFVEHCITADTANKIDSIFDGKKLTTYGDSITANGGWQSYLKDYFGFIIENKGIGGTTVADNRNGDSFCIQNRIDTISSDSDVVIIMGGTNDCGQSIEIGDLTYSNGFDTTKFKGGLATTIRMIQNRCPNALIFVASLCGGRGNTAGENLDTPVYNSKNLTSYDYAKATKDVAEFFNIQYIPIFEECGINCWNRATYIADTVHPNDYGKKQLAKIFIKHLSSYLIS